MAYYSTDYTDQGFLIKPRYKDDVLIYNWFEERALRDPSFLPLTTKPRKTGDLECYGQHLSTDGKHIATTGQDQKKCLTTANGQVEHAKGLSKETCNVDKNEKIKKENCKNEKDKEKMQAISPSDPLRGFYVSTYTRSYGARQGYVHLNSFPTRDFETRKQEALNPNGIQDVRAEDTSDEEHNCGSCEEMDASCKEGTGCLRCMQLAGM